MNIDVMINNNIVVGLGNTSCRMFSHGILKTKGSKKTINDWCDSKITSFSFDSKAEVLFKTDGTYKDGKSKG